MFKTQINKYLRIKNQICATFIYFAANQSVVLKKSTILFASFVLVWLSACQDTIIIQNKPSSTTDAPPVTGYLKKNALIEDYTGTWCGNCTRVAWAIEGAKAQSDKLVSVAIHNGNDPYNYDGIAPLKNLILPNSPLALPVSRLNRLTVWTFPETSNIQQVLDLTSFNTTIGLALDTQIVNNQMQVQVKLRCLEAYSDLYLVVYVLENHLLYNQRNYNSDLYGGQNPIVNFEHNHVLRATLTDIVGNPIAGTTFNSTQTFNFNEAVPTNIADASHISFVAFVTNKAHQVLNVREAGANEQQNFQINP
ncbi:MAG: hypothetical protein CFE24_04210 [Flavobacterium sp. BFFFF2]|nr:MAG: hypothetical protein CFE24_04210 [Flavobacterium sp. BFFFF2]